MNLPDELPVCFATNLPRRGFISWAPALAIRCEGDSTLEVILSKAFMLASDHQIKDESITRQIRPG